MMKRSTIYILIAVLAAILIALLLLAFTMGGAPQPTTPPTGSSQAITPSQSTAPTQTIPAPSETIPTETVPETSSPPAPDLYTYEELISMPTKTIGYGSGRTSNGIRAPYAENAQKQYGQYGARFIEPDNGAIFLTFDCGYEYTAIDENGNPYQVTEKILDVLKEKDVKAVFFITLPYAQKNPEIVQRMIDEGHAVGNHSSTHPVMPELTVDAMVEEVMMLHNYVLEHFGYTMALFRPPTGAFSVQSLCAIQNLGYESAFWSFAHVDYEPEAQPTHQAAYEQITQSHHSGAIYLLHAISTANAAVLGDVIDYFRTEGYTLDLLG